MCVNLVNSGEPVPASRTDNRPQQFKHALMGQLAVSGIQSAVVTFGGAGMFGFILHLFGLHGNVKWAVLGVGAVIPFLILWVVLLLVLDLIYWARRGWYRIFR
jgi:hypothetical protein